MSLALRTAHLNDAPVIARLIAESARRLGRPDYTAAQIEAALGTAWGLDTELVCDGTYFVAVADDEIVGCGGWSYRKTLYGADAHPGRQSEMLDPACDSARIRAFFVRPNRARQGTGRALLVRCETDARVRGFRSAELLATLPGYRLYSRYGYVGQQRVAHPLPGGLTIDFIPMRKALA